MADIVQNTFCLITDFIKVVLYLSPGVPVMSPSADLFPTVSFVIAALCSLCFLNFLIIHSASNCF